MTPTPKQAAFLAELAKLAVEAERMGLLTMIKDTVVSIVEGKPDEAKRRAERGAKAALMRAAIDRM